MSIHPGIISTASKFQNKSTQTEPQISAKKLKRCGAKILDANRSAFPLGGDETDVVKKSTNQFKFILDELIADFITKDSFFNQKIKTLFNDKKISLEERNSFKKSTAGGDKSIREPWYK
ncbi:hypothetical protein [Candidatus Regiella insecticola]|nr:hypothetical protein [Candidatus Regiella insecticola]